MKAKYRWIQMEDLDKMSERNKNDFIKLIKDKKTIANIVEYKDQIIGWIVYRVYKKLIKISKIGFQDEKTANFMLDNLQSKKGKRTIQVKASEYDLRLHLILKNNKFTASEINRINQIDYYKFTS